MKFRLKTKRINKAISIKDIYPHFIKEINSEGIYTLETIKQNWCNLTNKILSSHSEPYKLENDCLFVKTDHSVYSTDLSMFKKKIIDNLKVIYPDIVIKNIIINTTKNRYKK